MPRRAPVDEELRPQRALGTHVYRRTKPTHANDGRTVKTTTSRNPRRSLPEVVVPPVPDGVVGHHPDQVRQREYREDQDPGRQAEEPEARQRFNQHRPPPANSTRPARTSAGHHALPSEARARDRRGQPEHAEQAPVFPHRGRVEDRHRTNQPEERENSDRDFLRLQEAQCSAGLHGASQVGEQLHRGERYAHDPDHQSGQRPDGELLKRPPRDRGPSPPRCRHFPGPNQGQTAANSEP